MYDSIIDLLCDGDLNNRALMRQYFTIDEMETLAKEKAAVSAATNSEEIR
ncbi:hypothetical protein [Sporomusa sp. KB1]|jgi:hypothetical protein|nr:hypothetical protein [Sporomusa sp. KB1]TWH46359.1 hypothetical protein Salpa_2340 [Sporomusa sp. KB1]